MRERWRLGHAPAACCRYVAPPRYLLLLLLCHAVLPLTVTSLSLQRPNPLPPPPPPTLVESPIHLVVETRAHRGRCPKTLGPQRSNTRLKEKEPEVFVPVATKAIQRKALLESLAACSAT